MSLYKKEIQLIAVLFFSVLCWSTIPGEVSAIIVGENGITEDTPRHCIGKTYNIGYTEFVNICSGSGHLYKETIDWGTLQWSVFIGSLVAVVVIWYQIWKELKVKRKGRKEKRA